MSCLLKDYTELFIDLLSISSGAYRLIQRGNMDSKYRKITDVICENVYLEYLNDFLSIGKMAEYYEMEYSEIEDLINRGREINHKRKQDDNKN